MKTLNSLLVLMCLMLANAGSAAAVEVQGNEVGLDAPRVQQYLEAVFPQEYQALGGLLTLTARDPALEIPAQGQRLRLSFSADASSGTGERLPVGRVVMSSALRYDPAGHALYLDQPTLDEVQPATPGQRLDSRTRMLINLWLADYAGTEPLYRLEPAMISMLGPLKVESTRIENGRIVVRFNQPLGELPAYLDESTD
jgi:hypothetical protein